MRRRIRLPTAPQITAITRLDDLETLADEFEQREGFAPEYISHWDPKPEFESQIAGWISRSYTKPTSLVKYIYSSYLNFDDRIKDRLNETADRSLVVTPSGTTSIATVLTYLKCVGVDSLHVVTPSYFAVETLGDALGLSIVFSNIVRRDACYEFPEISPNSKDAVWLTLPIYGTSSYIAPSEVATFIDSLPPTVIVVVDESLSYLDRNSISETNTRDRVIRIATPHKALCINGEKVSIITAPSHLDTSFNSWTECLCGGIGANGMNALNFLVGDAFPIAVKHSRALNFQLHSQMKSAIGPRSSISTDQNTDGHFVTIYWPALPMSLSDDRLFMKEILDRSGVIPIPSSRNRHPSDYGFAFRVNLLKLDSAGLGGLKRLCDVLDSFS